MNSPSQNNVPRLGCCMPAHLIRYLPPALAQDCQLGRGVATICSLFPALNLSHQLHNSLNHSDLY